MKIPINIENLDNRKSINIAVVSVDRYRSLGGEGWLVFHEIRTNITSGFPSSLVICQNMEGDF